MTLKVKVSPHYSGISWFDPKAKMSFSKRDDIIVIPEGTNMYNINRYINLNYLIVVEDNKPIEEEIQTISATTPGKLLSEDRFKEFNAEKVTEELIEEIETTEEIVEEIEVIKEEVIDTKDEVAEDTQDEIESKDEKTTCQYCGKKYSPRGISSHEKACKKNPENM